MENTSDNISKCPVTGATGKRGLGASGTKTLTGGQTN